MRKIVFGLFFILLCPMVMGAIADQAYVNPSDSKIAPVDDEQTLNLSSDAFGMHGPFSLQAMYSKVLGLFFSGRFTQKLNKNNAASVELNAGKAQRRIAATWGHLFTARQRVKITAENLSQNLDFDFDSGKTSRWIYQNAIGLTYAYLITHGWIQDVNLNAYYSKAISRNLPARIYLRDGVLWRNYRRIAGGIDKSASLGIDVKPVASTLLGMQLNYDDVYYERRYESNKSDSGLGVTATLEQLLTENLKIGLLASYRKPYQDYKAQLNWLLNAVSGTQLELGLLGERIIGNLGLANDSRVGVEMNYSWGGDTSASSAKYGALTLNNAIGNLTDWTAQPAVHMQQVLAIKDQKSEAITPAPYRPDTRIAANNSNQLKVHPQEQVKINIAARFSSFAGASKDSKTTYAVEKLPVSHDLQFKDGVLSINKDSFQSRDVGQQFVLKFVSHSSMTNLASVIPLTIVVVGNGNVPYPNSQAQPGTATEYVNEPITDMVYGKEGKPESQVFINPAYWEENDEMTYKVSGLPAGLTYTTTQWYGKEYEHYAILTISGTPTEVNTYSLTVTATNKYGISTKSVKFNLEVKSLDPSITIYPHVFKKEQARTIEDTKIAKVMANEGEIKTLTVADVSKEGKRWSDYGLAYKIQPCNSGVNATEECVYVYGDISAATFAQQDFDITATNTEPGSKSVTKSFALQIQGVPEKVSDLGAGTYDRGDEFTSIDLTQHFKNPIVSGNMSFTVTAEGYPDVEKSFGIKVDGDHLVGTIKSDAPIVTDLKLKVTAKNDIGESTDAAEYSLTINPVQNPTITANPEAETAFTDGQARSSIWIEDIKAVSGELLEPITVDTTTLAAHGLTVDTTPADACTASNDGKTECKLYVKSDAVTEPTYTQAANVDVKVENTAGGSAAATFALNVRGVPRKDGDLGAGSYFRGNSFPTLNLHNYFTNPVKSGNMSFELTSDKYPTAQEIKEKLGLYIDDSGSLVGAIKSDAPIGDVQLEVTAKNDVGDSEKANYALTVKDAQAPTITSNPEAKTAFTDSQPRTSIWIEDIKAISGELQEPITVDTATLVAHGLIVDTTPTDACTASNNGKTECKIYVKADQVKSPTYTQAENVSIKAENTAGMSTTDNFALNVRGAPARDHDMGSGTKKSGETLNIKDLVSYFKNPTVSGDISEFRIDNLEELSKYGDFSIQGGELSGKIKDNPPGGTVDIKVSAKNNVDWSSKDNPAVYHLTVQPIYLTGNCKAIESGGSPIQNDRLTLYDTAGNKYYFYCNGTEGYSEDELIEAVYNPPTKQMAIRVQISKIIHGKKSVQKQWFKSDASKPVPIAGATNFKFNSSGAVKDIYCFPNDKDKWCNFQYTNPDGHSAKR